MAGTAMANVAIPQADFPADKAQSVSGTDLGFEFNFGQEGQGLIAPIGAGIVKFKDVTLCPGTYNLKVTGANNLTVTAAGKTEKISSGDGTLTFTLTAETTVSVQMTAINADAAFRCTGVALEIEINEAAVNAALTKLLGEVETIVALRDDVKDEALIKTNKKLNTDKTKIEENIAKIEEPLSLEDYKTFELWKKPVDCTIGVAIEELKGDVETYNPKAEEANKVAEAAAANLEAYNRLINQANVWQANLDQVNKDASAQDTKYNNNFVSSEISEKVAAFQKHITDLKKAIEAQKDNLTLEGTAIKGFEYPEGTDYNSMLAERNALNTAYAEAVAEQEAWVAYQDAIASLTKKYNDTYTLVNTLTVAVDKEDGKPLVDTDVFGTARAACIEDLTKLLNDNNNSDGALELGSPAADVNAAKNALPTIEEQMTARYNEFKTLVDAQNAAYVAAQTKITELDAKIKAAAGKEEDVPTSQKDKYEALVKAANEALAALKEYVDGQYTANTLPGEEYNAKVEAVEDAANALKNATDNYGPLTELEKQLTDAENDLAEIQKALNEEIAKLSSKDECGYDLVGKFDGQIKGLEEAIGALNPGESTDKVKGAIQNMITTASDLSSAYIAAAIGYDEFNKELTAYKTFIDGKVIIEGADYDKSDKYTGYDGLKTLLDGYLKDLKYVQTAESQESYNAAVALAKQIEKDDWNAKLTTAKEAFAKGATAANEAYATEQYKAVEKLIEDNKAVGNLGTKAPLKTLTDAWTAARAHVSMAGNDTEKLGACDTELQKLVASCATFTADVNAYIAFFNQIKGIPGAIAAAYDYNGKNTIDPAQSYFNGLLNPTDGEYTKRYNELVASLDKALSEGKLVEGMKGDKGFTATADALVRDVKGVEERILDNQTAYDELLGESQYVNNYIDRLIDDFGKKEGMDAAVVEAVTNALKDLKSNDLSAVDVKMTGDFGKGLLNVNTKEPFMNQYKVIKDKADNIIDDYNSNVEKTNTATAGNWEAGIIQLRELKDAAVKVYNAFYYDIKNEGYRAFINDHLKSHSHLYDFTQKITELKASIDTFIKTSNDNDVVFSQDDFKTKATDKIEAMKAQINADKDALIADMNQLGADYWTQESEYRGGIYQALFNSMDAAGMFAKDESGAMVTDKAGAPVLISVLLGNCPDLQQTIDSYFAAEAKHDAVVEAAAQNPKPEGYTYKNEMGYAMDAISDILDKVVYNETALEAAADLLWDSLYKAFDEKAQSDLKSVDTAEAYKAATDKQKSAAKEAIQEQIDLAAQYNEDATADDANTLSVLQDDGAKNLDAFAAKIQSILDELANQSEANVASNELYKKYTDEESGIIPGLNDDLQALKDYAASLAADSQDETKAAIAGAAAAIDELSKFVEANKTSLSTDENKAQAEKLAEDAAKAIPDAYGPVRTAETTVLDGLMTKVRVAFNNAKAETSWDGASAMEEKIDAALVALANLKNTEKPLSNEDFQTTAKGLEENLCNYLADLEAVYTHEGTNTAAVDAQARLTKQYEEVEAALEAAKTALGQCEESVQKEYADAYTSIEGELAKVKEEYSEAGNQVVVLEGNFAADLNAVQKAITDKQAEIEAANQAALDQKAIDANAKAIQEQINGYTKQLEEIRSYLNTYQLDRPEQLGGEITSIENMIAQMQTILNTMVAEKSLKADTKIGTAVMIEYELTNLNYNGHIAAFEYVRGLANTAIGDAASNLTRAHLLADTAKELSDKLAATRLLRANANQSVTDGVAAYEGSEKTSEDLETFFAVVEQAISDLTKVESDARAISESVYDNEFTPGDVNLEPDGEVDVTDVQIVMNWVGEGKTYDELLSENPRQAYAADVNGSKSINIADVVAILNIAIEDLNNPKAAPRYLAPDIKMSADNNIALALNGNEDGIREYAVLVNNATTFVAGQLDLKVSAGMEIVDIELTGRATDHELYRFDNSTGARVIVASMSNAALDGNSGALLIVRTRGAGNLEVDGAIFADKHATGFGLGNEGLSGIDSITESCQNVKERIYNVAGQAMNRLQRGINIIRKSDGTTTKEMH